MVEENVVCVICGSDSRRFHGARSVSRKRPPTSVDVQDASEQAALTEIVIRLAGRFPTITITAVDVIVHTLYDSFGTQPLRRYIPMLVEHKARRVLSQLSR